MAYKVFTDNKDTNQQKARMAVWALSDIRTPLAMDYVNEIIERPEYEGIAISVFRNLIFDHLAWFDKEKLFAIVSKISKKFQEEKDIFANYLKQEYKMKDVHLQDLTNSFSMAKLEFLPAEISNNEKGNYNFILPILPFIFEGQTIDTQIYLSMIPLENEIVSYAGKTISFPINPEKGYIDGSIYMAERHNPVDVSKIKFKTIQNNLLEIELTMKFDFEYEGTGLKNEEMVKMVGLKIV